ncbi:MAG: phosphatase PAP2 family protein [Bacteroidales bacterium]|nr:phosphatase PAP2 family protein [Bacteroidales bacterium]
MLQFDQQATLFLNGSQNLFLDNLMITVTSTFSWSLLIVMLIYILFKNNNWKEALFILFTIGMMIFVADRICSGWIKPTIARWRPTRDPEIMYLIDTVLNYRGGRFGFFSGHACNTSCVAMFLAWLFREKRLTFILFLWSVTTTYTRLYLGVHYLGDVLVGWSVGLTLGCVFYFLYNRVRQRVGTSQLISGQFTSSGYPLGDIHLFITAIAFNYIIITIYAITRGII